MPAKNPYVREPGVYDDVPAEVYHSHCTPRPALNASGAWIIETECPAAYYAQAAFNPRRIIEEPQRHFDIGKASHLIVLEPAKFERTVAEIEAPNYRALDAQRARDLYREAGRIPLLTHELQMVRDMRDALRAHPIARFAFESGVPERSFFWIDEATGEWQKARPDLANGPEYLVDYKTCASANPQAAQRAIWNFGYHFKAAHYLDGYAVAYGTRPARYALVFQSKEPPYLISVGWLSDDALAWGAIQNRHARAVFARCLARNEWPGFRPPRSPDKDIAFEFGLPVWAERELQTRHDKGEFEIEAPQEKAA